MRALGRFLLWSVFWAAVIAALHVQRQRAVELEATEVLGFQGQWTPIDESLLIERRCREWEEARTEAIKHAGW